MSFRPLHDRVVVRRVDSEEKSAGGIIIPDTAKEKPSEGVVEAVGPGARDDSGKIIEFESPEIEELQHQIAEQHGYTLDEHSLVLYVRKKR